jgi:hypothetical protein
MAAEETAIAGGAAAAPGSSSRRSWRSTPTSRDASSAASSAVSSSRPGSTGGPRAVRWDRLRARGLPRRRGDRRRATARGADAVPDVVAVLASGRRVRRRRPRLRERARRDHRDGRRLLRRGRIGRSRRSEPSERFRGRARERAPSRQLRREDAHGGPVRPLRDLGRPRRRDREQDRVADRVHDAVRRLGVRVQPDRRPLQEPGPAAGGRDRRARRDRAQSAIRGPVAGPDRRERGRVQLPAARPDPVLARRQAAVARRDGRPRLRRRDRRARRPHGRHLEFKRQVPPIAKLGPRTAGVDYLYPRRRPGSARG